MDNDITLNMIVGRFEEPFLDAALKSVSPICAEVILIDTAPGGNPNREVMDRSGAKVINYFSERGEGTMDFSFARNLALGFSTTEWVMKVDADEVFHVKQLARLYEAVRTTDAVAVEISFWHHFLHPDLYRVEHQKKCTVMRRESLHWEGAVHEQSNLTGEILKVHDVYFNHYGYVKPQSEIRKRWALYEDLGNGPGDMESIPETGFLDYLMPELLYYKEEHPPCVVPKLRELFPDLGTFKKPS
jgi:hypothetical protein